MYGRTLKYSLDPSHARKASKVAPRLGSRPLLVSTTTGLGAPLKRRTLMMTTATKTSAFDTHESDEDEVGVSKRPGPQRRLLSRKLVSFNHNVPRPLYHDRWNAAFGVTTVDERRGRSRSRHGHPRSARCLARLAFGSIGRPTVSKASARRRRPPQRFYGLPCVCAD
jgi:hypothetical protein